MWSRAAIALVAGAAVAAGCTPFPESFACERDGQCVRGGDEGRCIEPGHCAFPDGRCGSGWRWDPSAGSVGGSCVPADGEDGGPPPMDSGRDSGPPPRDGGGDLDTGGGTNACGGSTPLSGSPGDPCGPCDSGMLRCAGTESLECDGSADLEVPITADGTVSASTEYSSSFRAELSVDGDLTTSWFSSGPESMLTEYVWTAPSDECIGSLSVIGNDNHDNRDFRTGYGFGRVTVQVRLADDTIVYSDVVSLPGTPDPAVEQSPEVVGRKVVLLFTGHEADDCGGFSELTVEALR